MYRVKAFTRSIRLFPSCCCFTSKLKNRVQTAKGGNSTILVVSRTIEIPRRGWYFLIVFRCRVSRTLRALVPFTVLAQWRCLVMNFIMSVRFITSLEIVFKFHDISFFLIKKKKNKNLAIYFTTKKMVSNGRLISPYFSSKKKKEK